MTIINKIIQFRLLIISIIIVCFAIFYPCKFQKGGVHDSMYYTIILMTIGLSILFILPSKEMILFEKIILSVIFAFFTLFITTALIMDRVLYHLYGTDYDFVLWESTPRISANIIYFSLNTFIVIGFLKTYDIVQRKMK